MTKPKVLVVDDEHVLADTLAIILNRAGFDAKAAYDGMEAVEAARSWRPELMICDVIMPGMNGIEAAICILEFLPGCKIILDGYLLDYPNPNRLWLLGLATRALSLGFGVIAIVIVLAFIGKIHALPGSFAQEAGACNWETELSPATFPKYVNVVSPAEDNNVVLPNSELFALVGSGRIWDRIPVHFLHLGVTDTDFRKKHPCFYSVMRTVVATAHPIGLYGGCIVQYLHTGINVNAFGGSLAGVGNADAGTQRLAWVNKDRRGRLFRLTNKIDSEPSPFVGLRSVKLSLVNNQSQGGNYEHEGISDKLKPIYQSRTTRLIVGCLFLASAAILFLYAQIIPARCYLLGRNLAVGLVIGLLLLVLGFLCTAQFYDLVLK